MITQLSIAGIDLDGSTTQARAGHDAETVASYADAMRDGARFPPPVVFRDSDGTIRVGDGHHRLLAAREAGMLEVACEVRDGTARDALLHAVEANARHGLRWSRADRRRVVHILLDDAELSRLSDRELGRRAGVDHKTVSAARRERSGEFPHRDDHPQAPAARVEGEPVREREPGEDDDLGEIPDDEDVAGRARAGEFPLPDPLTAAERRRLAECEATIAANLGEAAAFVGALDAIERAIGPEAVAGWLRGRCEAPLFAEGVEV